MQTQLAPYGPAPSPMYQQQYHHMLVLHMYPPQGYSQPPTQYTHPTQLPQRMPVDVSIQAASSPDGGTANADPSTPTDIKFSTRRSPSPRADIHHLACRCLIVLFRSTHYPLRIQVTTINSLGLWHGEKEKINRYEFILLFVSIEA
jgi:hypothetical protein